MSPCESDCLCDNKNSATVILSLHKIVVFRGSQAGLMRLVLLITLVVLC